MNPNTIVTSGPCGMTQGGLMGLNERRKIKELQDTTFPGRVKEIEEISAIQTVAEGWGLKARTVR